MQFFTQSNPLNNLNITSSIPPILQRQNSAPTQPAPNPANGGEFFKPKNPPPVPSTAGEIHRKYSLPMNSLSAQPMAPNSLLNHQMIRKQSAPTIQSMAPSQQFQQPPQGSPSRARDRNNFDKLPSSQDVQQLPPLKGVANDDAHLCSIKKLFCSVLSQMGEKAGVGDNIKWALDVN